MTLTAAPVLADSAERRPDHPALPDGVLRGVGRPDCVTPAGTEDVDSLVDAKSRDRHA
ncbi:hypothetical protein [Streptomyces ureilyticus]|uniref:Uncharacterized protein n=1 Tax=Streptomyces ureilyticus TaxID=1775131 RepID=A0ABX0DRX1_9ACTN|nr:hypothetical protein [Streptomyces ureilyticus]NGO43224.1 hypothetical protein [Streptomyces ureilyticus]